MSAYISSVITKIIAFVHVAAYRYRYMIARGFSLKAVLIVGFNKTNRQYLTCPNMVDVNVKTVLMVDVNLKTEVIVSDFILTSAQ